MADVVAVDWDEARHALGEVTSQLTGLLRSIDRPSAPALGQWDVAGLATHLSHAFDVVPRLAAGTAASPLGDLWELTDLTVGLVEDDPERDLALLADLIDTRLARFLEASAAGGPGAPCPWLVDGATLRVVTLTCHLLNEATVHGHDLATAVGRRWPINPRHAALIFEGFLLAIFQALDPRTFVVQERAAGLRACYDVRLRGSSRFFLVFDDGAMTVEAPSGRRVDCHLSVDPAAFLLVAWDRSSQWHAIPRGQLLAWGRRPWLGLRFRSLLRSP